MKEKGFLALGTKLHLKDFPYGDLFLCMLQIDLQRLHVLSGLGNFQGCFVQLKENSLL